MNSENEISKLNFKKCLELEDEEKIYQFLFDRVFELGKVIIETKGIKRDEETSFIKQDKDSKLYRISEDIYYNSIWFESFRHLSNRVIYWNTVDTDGNPEETIEEKVENIVKIYNELMVDLEEYKRQKERIEKEGFKKFENELKEDLRDIFCKMLDYKSRQYKKDATLLELIEELILCYSDYKWLFDDTYTMLKSRMIYRNTMRDDFWTIHADNVEYISLVGEGQEKSKEFNQKVFDLIRDEFTAQPYNNQKQPELITEILNSLCEKITAECSSPTEANIVRQSIVEIEKLISDGTNKGPEEIMSSIPEPIDVLKALLFVAKNPNRYELFLEALTAYHSDLITKRRAAVLWGALNGLYGMPGDGFNKDNQILWQFIEAYVFDKEDHIVPTFSVKSPEVAVEKGVVLGITLREDRIVTAREIREAVLSMAREKLPFSIYTKLLEAAEVEAGSKKKAENKGYAHSIASLSLPEIKKGDELSASVRKVLEQLVKDCKSTVPNKEKLFADYVENESKFAFVFDMDPGYWKKTIKIVPEKTNA